MKQPNRAGLEPPPRLVGVESSGSGKRFERLRRVENRCPVFEVAARRHVVELAEQAALLFAENADDFICRPNIKLAFFAFAVGVFG